MRIISDDAIWSLNDYIKKWDTIEITDEMLLTLCHGFSQQILCNKLDMNQVLAMTIRNELIEYLKSVIGEEK